MASLFPTWSKPEPIDHLVGRSTFQRLHPEMQGRIRALIEASDGKVGLGEGFRSEESQRAMFLSRYEVDPHGSVQFEGKRWRKIKKGLATAAPPGRSMHEIGLAVDLAGDHAWVVANSNRFSLKHFAFVNDEPWHVQPFELPNSRSQYEKQGAAWKVAAVVSLDPAAPPVADSPMLEVLPGMRGPMVGQLQDILIRLGLMKDSVANRDEFYGPGTQAIVRKFQESRGLKGDARVGPKTWAALRG